MAQASIGDPSSDRAVSSEPCSTRPNPFEDNDLSSRKRRRTSLASDSRSRSVETIGSSPSPPVAATSAIELRSDSAMKIDSDLAIPATPERQQPAAEPASEPRSSRVTINQVPRAFIEWIDKYLDYVKTAPLQSVEDSTVVHRDMWQTVPPLVLHMVTRKSFAQLTAFFIEIDLRVLRSQTLSDEALIQALASPSYIHALGALMRREEVAIHSSSLPRNGDDDWSYVAEMMAIVDAFQNFPVLQGGSLLHIRQLATLELRLASQFPRLITDHLGNLCLVAGNIMKYTLRKAQYPPGQQVSEPANRAIARMYAFFTTMAAMLSDMVDKNLNQLSPEGAANLIEGLTEVYQTCIAADGVVPSDVIDRHLLGHPPVPAHLVPEAIAYHWKFTHFVKLIRSGQMQLRVMAVSTMCSDLVALYRKSADPLGEEATLALLHYVADFLLSTGLVNYILGPTCHPEITLESSNIIGFLVVSATYSRAHTDTLWQTVTSTQDPRVSDALIRMIGRITNLFTQESLMYFLEKFNTIPVEVFGSTMREFCDQVLKQIITRFPESLLTDSAPFDLFIRLIRQSSGLGSQSPVAYPDLQQFAIQKFDSVLNHGPDQEGRWKIYRDCLSDIAQRSPSTIGSIWVLKMATRFHHARDLHELASEHDLTKLLIEELAAAWGAERSSEGTYHRSLGRNPFASICFAEYLLALDPKFFCQGALDFVREGVMPLVNDPTSIVLDDEENPKNAGIEMLWRIALTAPTGTVERRAIHALVSDVYVESRSIRSFQPYRARKVHLALVDRCLGQLSSAAARLKTFADGTASGDDDSMVIIATDRQIQEQELLFVRSLAVLREFHRAHRAKSDFSAPDMRSLILESPKEMEGEPAELKYQSFDGDKQSAVMPLTIGKHNTGADLLAKLREVAGFECYQIYYRGRPFVPQESDLRTTLEDLQIHNGILLVKREPEAPSSPRVPQGASPVEVEILNHFDELWEYLSIDEKLAREMYGFLVKLPRDKKLLGAISDPSVSYLDIFPVGQPFKSLYAVDALQEYLGSWRPKAAVVGGLTPTDDDYGPRLVSSARAMSLVVPAISDPHLVAQCPNQELQIELGPELPASATQFLDPPLLHRLLAILSVATSPHPQKGAIKHISLCLQSILESCCVSDRFLSAFAAHPDVTRILEDLLLNDLRATVRRTTAILIREKTGAVAENESCSGARLTTVAKLREFFWPLISRLVRPAIASTGNSAEILELCSDMLGTLEETQIGMLDLKQLSNDWFDLLINYTTSEDLTRPDEVDLVAAGLVRLLHAIVCNHSGRAGRDILPARGIARKVFWKHLFPLREEVTGECHNRPIACPQTRGQLMEIIFRLVKDDPTQYMWLLEDMHDLVPVFPNQEEFYSYELPQQFERAKTIRAACGYPGVRNLSNTCYFNSLLTQLFMNVDFREFMLGATVRDRQYSQQLLFQTQKLFAFLQDSVRPFINPEECVASIKTYEDTQIDVVIQMDVDEFYNLLFDRWEGQFLTADEKNRFRSFYGGQLVQQVRSQECEHVSERLEPFSAIQCDIKGKSTLQESLQAYVDGEIMEGDNLICHLKRFDFNLRTMQRSKINDYFAFPDKIDMRPYTIDHLSNPSGDESEDIFELVGVLVHSGTAESGHYYSYIRERPTDTDTQTWVEFNDEAVTPWDPASMANSCFGGQDFQPQFQSSNAVFEKQYSAYMLFYQRSSARTRNQVVPQQPEGRLIPPRVKMPKDIQEFIEEENAWLLRRHCLFDPSQIQFVCLILSNVRSLHSNACSADHTLETQAIAMALSHLDQVASRTKDVPDFYTLLGSIQTMLHNYFSRYIFALRMLMQRNVDEDVRQATANFMIHVFQSIKEHAPAQYGLPTSEADGEGDSDEYELHESVIAGVIDNLEHLWQNFHMNLRSWHEVFDFMLSFVKMGRYELAAFLGHRHFFKWLLWIVWADTHAEPFLPPQFAKMVAVVARRPANRPPSYETIIALLDFLLSNIRLPTTASGHPTGVANARERVRFKPDMDQPFDITVDEAEILHRTGPRAVPVNIFADRLISIAQNPAATHSIITTLMKESEVMENSIFHTLLFRITGQIGHPNAEGKAFLDFMRETFDGPRERTGETAHQVAIAGLDNVPDWAPGLLGYFDTSVIDGTEAFLHEKIFRYRTFRPSGSEDTEEARELAEKMRLTARALGVRCLYYLRDNYVVRSVEVTERAVGGLQRVIKQCGRYFNLKDPVEDNEAPGFVQLNQVDELEEDGSDWANSSVCSGQLDGFEDAATDELRGGEE
ncbi:uncharacterized protein B0H64DRAFT_417531 [Chaetomium fimeti]|uniref:USP domain-containing protein n=1 Tax=Chaetomium fimeti TaxID=1854472 RepID=A0AAE0HG39_9PEZI|nr:hypothetical protein B0H64DRAFT_417531 [Chaetomium fimeti]